MTPAQEWVFERLEKHLKGVSVHQSAIGPAGMIRFLIDGNDRRTDKPVSCVVEVSPGGDCSIRFGLPFVDVELVVAQLLAGAWGLA